VNVGIVSGVERFGTYVPIRGRRPTGSRERTKIWRQYGTTYCTSAVFDMMLFIGFNVVCEPHVVQIV
jgi:hypothetical protein